MWKTAFAGRPICLSSFKQRWGYDLRTKLPQLYEETGSWRQVRHNYYTLLGDLFVERWAKPYSEFAESNNLLWTGHHFDHDWPKPKNGGDWASLASYQQMPGIDVLFNDYGEELRDVNTQFGNARAVKELSSVANQMGRNRAISETYGGAGWNLTFQDMKRIADWQFALGVNFLNQHLSYMTIKGSRKRDYPPSFSYHEPWWQHFGVLGDYFSRLSVAMSAGEQVNHTLVLMPTTSAWMYVAPSGTPSHIDFYNIGDQFQAFVNNLEAHQVEYDLGSERVIRDQGSIRNSSFVVGERSYDRVVIPPGMRNVDRHTLDLLNKYVEQDGKVIFAADSLQRYVDGAPSEKLKQLHEKGRQKQWTNIDKLTASVVDRYLPSKGFKITTDTSNGMLFHRRMQLEDGQLLLLVNTSEKGPAEGTVEVTGLSVQQLDLFTGDIRGYTSQSSGESVSFSFALPPVGSQLFYISDQASQAEEATRIGQDTAEEVLETGSMQVRREQSNVLTLDYLDLKIDGKTDQDIYYADAAEEIFEQHGFEEGNPWYMTVQYKTSILDRNNYGPESGFTASFEFDAGDINESARNTLEAVVEQPELWEVSVNDTVVEPDSGDWWLDRSFGVYEIGEYVKPGKNEITLHAFPMTVFSELERVFIRGDFMLESTEEGWRMTQDQPLTHGAWNKQGMPFYADHVSYTKNIELTRMDEDSHYLLRLNDWKGTVAAVKVNGEQAGVIGWPPYELEVTEALQEGGNKITVDVYGSLRNLLGPHHESPRHWRVSPGEFGDGPEHQPPGREYDIIGYGLMEDFDLVQQKLR
ncbi:hypothetical protein [Aliifodinibius sp. S!AR15-10]|uniref:hypothetical protein n=1 Tax=Aliifodinibius sp. S!AR15-10 TaxID=2950437 RepID=UPI0028709144|nr:hypothetical protein [Aliifodinibius sp. S!AR15-10]